MDAAVDPTVHTVAVKKSAQVGYTEALLNLIGYYIDQDPAPILLVQPTLDMAEAFSKDRLAPMLRDTPALAGKVQDARSRDSGNTLLHKALALDTPIPTPTGWTTIGDISPGDTVFGESGLPCEVVSATDVYRGRPCYRVEFSDGSSIVADDEHGWPVEEWKVVKSRGKARQTNIASVKTTGQMASRCRNGDRARYAVKTAGALVLNTARLPVDPYVLGAWIGDGLSHRGALTVSMDDAAEFANIIERAGLFDRCSRYRPQHGDDRD